MPQNRRLMFVSSQLMILDFSLVILNSFKGFHNLYGVPIAYVINIVNLSLDSIKNRNNRSKPCQLI